MSKFDLASMQSGKKHAMRLLGLLVHMSLFEPGSKSLTYKEINARLSRHAGKNESGHFTDVIKQINQKLLDSTSKGNRGVFNTVEFVYPTDKTIIWKGTLLTSALLLEKCKLNPAPETARFDTGKELSHFDAVSALTKSEIAFRVSKHRDALRESGDALRIFGFDNAPQWLLLHHYTQELRTNRRLENSEGVRRVLSQARVTLQKWKDTEGYEILDGLIEVNSAWQRYDILVRDQFSVNDTKEIEDLLNSRGSKLGAEKSNFLAFERRNLLALVLRRRFEALKEIEADENHIQSAWEQALTHNMEAIKYAVFASDLTALSNACGNRTPILNAMFRRKKYAASAKDWTNSLLWLALSWDIAEQAGLGGDNLWSPIYLLTTHRFATEANGKKIWKEMMTNASQKTAWFKKRAGKHVVNIAMEMSEKMLENILSDSKKAKQEAFARQLAMFAGELGGAGMRSHPFTASPHSKIFITLSEVLAQIPKKAKMNIKGFEEEERHFLAWKNELLS